MSRQISFLCSFGGTNGWGHLVRSSAVAQAAKALGWRVVLIGQGPMESIPSEILQTFDERLFVSTFDSLPEVALSSNALFVDFMYRENEFYHSIRKAFKPNGEGCKVLVATDDMQNRFMDAVDIVVNPEIGLAGRIYRTEGEQLLGESFAYLRRGFSNIRTKKIELHTGNPISVFVMIGGTDPWNLSVPVLRELSRIGGHTFSPILLSGEQVSYLSELDECLSLFPDSRWLCSISSSEMATLMSSCAFGIIACGSSVFEMAALNVPFVGLSIVDNQTATARKIEKNWGLPILYLEDRDVSKELGLERAVQSLLRSYSRFENRYSSVDTKGCERIMKVIAGRLDA